MAITRTQQYCAVATNEIAEGEGLSSRAVTDMIRAVNNLKAYSCAPIILPNNVWPGGLDVFPNSTDEEYIASWPPFPLAHEYTRIRFAVSAALRDATDIIKLTLYADRTPYSSADPVTANVFSPHVASANVTFDGGVDGTAPAVYLNRITGVYSDTEWPQLMQGDERKVYLTLTAQSTASNDRMYLYSIAAWAELV